MYINKLMTFCINWEQVRYENMFQKQRMIIDLIVVEVNSIEKNHLLTLYAFFSLLPNNIYSSLQASWKSSNSYMYIFS